MRGMYQVYSQQRPGRPRWALGASAILLLATVGLAAALVHYKTGGERIILKPFSTRSGLKGKMPSDWKELQDGVPQGTLLALVEPAEGQKPGRRLFFFGRPPFPFAAPAKYAKAVAGNFAQEALSLSAPSSGEMRVEKPPGGSTDQIAGLRAVTVLYELKTPARQNGPAWFCLARATVLPGGQVIGLALLTSGEMRATDVRLLDRVSRELEVPSLRPSGVFDEIDEPRAVPASTVFVLE